MLRLRKTLVFARAALRFVGFCKRRCLDSKRSNTTNKALGQVVKIKKGYENG